MLNRQFIDEISNKIISLTKSSPAEDLNKNIRALIQGVFTKMELVTREEFDAQSEVLQHTRAKLDALEQQIAALEKAKNT